MDLEGEEQIKALQADLDRADGLEGGDGEAQVEDAELIQNLDSDALRSRMDVFTEK